MRILSVILWRDARSVRRELVFGCGLIFVATLLTFLARAPEELGLGRCYLHFNAFGTMAIAVLGLGLAQASTLRPVFTVASIDRKHPSKLLENQPRRDLDTWGVVEVQAMRVLERLSCEFAEGGER
jgi:multidrug transporter EmrE-like cation transporter